MSYDIRILNRAWRKLWPALTPSRCPQCGWPTGMIIADRGQGEDGHHPRCGRKDFPPPANRYRISWS